MSHYYSYGAYYYIGILYGPGNCVFACRSPVGLCFKHLSGGDGVGSQSRYADIFAKMLSNCLDDRAANSAALSVYYKYGFHIAVSPASDSREVGKAVITAATW